MKKHAYKTAEEYAKVLTEASEAYYNSDETTMSDAEYDILFDEFQERFPDHSFFKEIGAKASNLFKKVTHEIAMGSQAKVNTKEELEDWWKKTVEKVGAIEVVVSEKLDGFSLSLAYDKKLKQSITRGDGVTGEDVTQNVEKIKEIPQEISLKPKISVRGEALISKSTYLKNFSDKANARNAAAGTIRRLDGERCEYLSFRAYDVVGMEFKKEEDKLKLLKTLGFTTPNYKICSTVEEVHEVWEEYETKKRNSNDFEMDGLVVMVNDLAQQEVLGIINKRPRYSRAYKFSAESGVTTLESCEWQVGRTGRITPVGKVTPVKVAGVTISSVTLHNLAEIEKLGLKLGQKVEIKRAGDVIPKITKVLDPKGRSIPVPSKCPTCNQKTTVGEIFLTCDNTLCDSKKYFALLHWVKSLEIKGFGEELVDRLIEEGLVKEPSDFYELKKEQMENLERMGEKSAEKVLKELHSKKSMTIPLFVKALGIPQASEKTVELILPYYSTLESMADAPVEKLGEIHGIGEITAKVLVDGLKTRKKIISNLMKHITLVEPKKVVGGKLQGQSFCFTGVRDKNLEVALVEAGAIIASGVSKNLTVLVAKDPEENSSKLKKARDMGVEILTLTQVWERVR